MQKNNSQLDFLKEKFKAGQLGHSYIFSGMGAAVFAKDLVRHIHCRDNQKTCQSCPNCLMVAKEIFPDSLVIKSSKSNSSLKGESDTMEIDVSQIRAAQHFLALKPYYGNYKTLLVENAERMNTEAQNCFLKTLEEPRGKTVIFLATLQPHVLLPTIFSRCQEIRFFNNQKNQMSPEEQKVLGILQGVMGDGFSEKFKYVKSENLEGERFFIILSALRKHFRELLISKIQGKSTNTYSLERIKKVIRLVENISHQATVTNINQKLALEVLMLEI